ncbi:TIM barrel protein [Aeromicrobium sp. IC_218]|uniref:sugar phosphate isomerase/epimerase family protein n=1 Tax=Aeromicrobium sp. IC_218 TaxID=2545468 RepID=UPI00103E892D|nr:TIM barrel protein [Aeromicrobium sp. IC_218]TCI96361.1 sugar phosphate isomerase/epimerase [Aeromicrobium sp. IC_218]
MFRTWSLAHLSALELHPVDLINLAADTGCAYVGLRATRLTTDEPHYPLIGQHDTIRQVKERCAATGVRVHDLEVARLDSETMPEDLLPLLHTAAELGCLGLVTQVPDADKARARDKLGALADLAQPLGLRLEVEFVSWTEVPDLISAAQLVDAVGHPAVGVLVDFLHFDRANCDLAQLASLPRGWFQIAHVNDAPATRPTTNDGLIHAARHDRLVAGTGDIDVRGIVASLPRETVLAIETPSDRGIAEYGAAGYVRRLVSATQEYLGPSHETTEGATS